MRISWEIHIYFTSFHCTRRYELNKSTSLPMSGFTAQLVEHHTGVAEVTGSIPVETLVFFRLLPSNSFQFMHTQSSGSSYIRVWDLKCPWHEIFCYLVRKSFQNDEEWRLFYCDSTLGCRVIQDFDLCKLDMCDVTKGTESGFQITKNWISVQILNLQGWNFARLMYCNNYTFW